MQKKTSCDNQEASNDKKDDNDDKHSHTLSCDKPQGKSRQRPDRVAKKKKRSETVVKAHSRRQGPVVRDAIRACVSSYRDAFVQLLWVCRISSKSYSMMF